MPALNALNDPCARCAYCSDQGFYSDDLSGGESYCDCQVGVALLKSVTPVNKGKPRPTAWDRLKKPGF